MKILEPMNCKKCEYREKIKTLSGYKNICKKTNKKVKLNHYCGKVPLLNITDMFDYKK